MIIFHSNRTIVEYPVIKRGKCGKDFYFGFYCVKSEDQCRKRAIFYNEKRYLNKYEYIPDDTLKYKVFNARTEEWLDFVVACRQGNSHRYDIVEDPMADDIIIQYYMDNKISRAEFWESIKYQEVIDQISFHTVSALDTLNFIGSESITVIKEISP